MRRAATALAWEFWSANRRGWLILFAAMPVFAAINLVVSQVNRDSEALEFFAFLPMVMSVILAIAFCNFTDQSRRDGIAGFPRHLFVLPLKTPFLVTWVLGCSLVSVLVVYVAWVTFVLRPWGAAIQIGWPVTLLTTGVVFYQSIVWCLCGYRLTRVVALSIGATMLVGIAFVPTLAQPSSFWASEGNLSWLLAAATTVAYGATLITVDAQRRGGARGSAGIQTLLESAARAIPRRDSILKSPDAALFWLEWRRAGLVLPAAVLLTTLIILRPVLSITGREGKETLWAEMWLTILPMVLAFPIGMGFGKPDFWSLDVSMSPFLATRPITAAQLISAKMKAAAFSAIASWAIVLIIAPAWIYLACNTEHWWHLWYSAGILYGPFPQCALPILALAGAIFLTWSLLVQCIWLGYSGRPAFYYSVTGIGLAAFQVAFFVFIWWLDHPRTHGDMLVGMLPWLPWALAASVTANLLFASTCTQSLLRRRLISRRDAATYTAIWLFCTALLVWCAWLMAPRIEWFRNIMILAALQTAPCASIVVAPITISWNRHR